MKKQNIFSRSLLLLCFLIALMYNAHAQCGGGGCLTSSDFSSNLNGWYDWSATSEGASANFAALNGELAITNINASGQYNWITILKDQVKLEQGKTYTITFDARSTTGRPITVGPRKGFGDYASYTERNLLIGTTMETQTIVYTHLAATDNAGQLIFFVGATNDPVYIDNLCVKEGAIPSNGVSLNILPIGNSISQGLYYVAGTYRKPLYYDLTALGYNVNMVGSKQAFASPTGTSPFGGEPDTDLGWDQDHECYWGWTTSQVLGVLDDNIPNWDAVPDIVTLHLGTNNLSTGPAGLKDIIDLVRTVNPNVTVFVARLITSKNAGFQSSITTYNNNLDAMAPGWSTAESPVIVVDQNSTLNVNIASDWADALHPSKSGAVKMAKVWLEAIDAQFAPPPIVLQNVNISETLLTLEEGDAAILTAEYTPSDATNKNVTWSSANELIATVTACGRVVAVGVGTTQIILTSEVGPTDQINIEVTPAGVVNLPTFAALPSHFRTTRDMPFVQLSDPVMGVLEVKVSSFGGFPDDGADDRVAIQAAIDAAAANAPARVVFDPGTYDIMTFRTETEGYDKWVYNRHSVYIRGVSNIELEGNNATILNHNPLRGFMSLNSSENIIIKDLTFDYATLPFTQGEVIARDNNSVTVRIDNGFPLPTEPHFTGISDAGTGVYLWSMLKDGSKSGALKPGAPNLYENMGFTSMGGRDFKFNVAANDWYAGKTEVGDYWVYQARYNDHGIYDCLLGKNITILNNTIYTSPASVFTGGDNWETNIINTNAILKLGSGRIQSANADIIHVNGGPLGPWVQGCRFEAFADDAINIKHTGRTILDVPASDQLKLQYDVKAGETLEIFILGTGQYLGEFTIVEIVSINANDFTVRLDRAHGLSASQTVTATGNSKTSAKAFLTSRADESFIFRDNEFINHRGWGIIVQAKYGEISGNTFDGSSSGGVKFDNISNWGEGFLASNVVVDNNTFSCVANDNESFQYNDHGAIVSIITITAAGCSATATWCPSETINTFQGIKNISITNNDISFIKTGTQIENIDQLTYSGNNFSTCPSVPFSGIPVAEIFVNNAFVGPTTVSGVSLNAATLALTSGATSQLTAIVAPASATNKSVTWLSSNADVATVSATGLVTAVAAGTATITVTTVDGSFSATCAVTVTLPVSVTGVSLNTATLALNTATSQLTATVAPANATNKSVTWLSSNTAVATVSATGLVTAVAAGTATITVTTVDGSFSATCAVTVTIPTVSVTGVSLNAATLVLTTGATSQLTATVAPANATNKSVTWLSSNATVATVGSTGLVTAGAAGTAAITVTTVDGSFSATCEVTVPEPINCSTYNGDFNNGMAGWADWAYTDGGVTANFAVVNGELAVTNISAQGRFDWLSVVNAPVTLEQGKSYIITFDARSTTERVITVGPRKGFGDYATYTKREKVIGPAMETHTIVYTHVAATDNAAQIIFFLGAYNDAIYIDNLCVVEGTIPQTKASLNILPIGNSISQGNVWGSGTYRKMLYYELSNMGYNINMIGTMSSLAGSTPFSGSPDTDPGWEQNHECYWGYTTSQVLSLLNTNVNSLGAIPDVVTLHLGTNNLTFPDPIPDLGAIIDLIRTVNPNVTVFIAQLITAKTSHDDYIPGFNSNVAILASQKNTAQSPVIVVNQYTTLDKAKDGDWADALHPSQSGAAKMTKVWLQAIETEFGGEVTPTYSLTVNGGSGDGSYQDGTTVNIVADVPVGYEFDAWVVNSGPAIIANQNSWSTTVTTGAVASVITATFTEVVNPYTDALTALNGPTTVGAGTSISVSVDYEAAGSRQIVIALQETTNYTAVGSAVVSVSAGNNTATVTLAIDAAAVGANNYRYAAYMIPVGGVYADRVAEITLNNITVSAPVDEITSISGPVVVVQGSTVNVSVTYEASANREIHLVFQKDTDPWTWYGSNAVAVSSGTGTIDVSVATDPTAPLGVDEYQYSVFITPVGGDWATRFNNISQINVDLTTISVTETLTALSGPTPVDAGSSVTVSVNYEAADAREIVFSLQETVNFTSVGSNVVSVSAGAGTATTTLNIDAAAASASDYRYVAYMIPVGGAYEDNVAEIDLTGITVIPVAAATYTLTVENGSGDGEYENGTVVSIVADVPASGYEFSGWTVSGSAVIADANAASTTVTTGAAASTVTANYTLTLVDALASLSGPTPVDAGTTVTVSVNYEAADAREIVFTLQETVNYTAVGANVVSVSAGNSTATATFAIDAAAVGASDYRYVAYMIPVGGAYEDNVAEIIVNNITIIAVPVNVTGVSLNASTLALNTGATSQLTATVAPANATNQSVTWASSNTAVATVSASGLVTAVAAGTATITVTTVDGGFSATCAVTVTVPTVNVTGVSLNASTLALNTGATSQLTATVAPANATNQSVTWASSNTAVATVSASGLVTAVAAGTATITVTTVDGGFSATSAVTITTPTVNVTGVSLNASTLALNTGATSQLTATVAPANATNQSVTWASSNTAVATVSASGLVTAVSAGTATITVTTTDGGFTATSAVTITSPIVNVTGVSVTPATVSLVTGGTQQLTATVSPANATNNSVTWASSNTAIATVSASGLVTAVADGSATITVTTVDGGFTATSAVTVSATPPVSNLALNKPLTFSESTSNTQLVDGNRTSYSYWKVPSYPGWAEVDLGADYNLTKMDVYTHAYYQGLRYKIEVKTSDGSSYTTVVDRTGNTTLASLFSNDVSITGRYVKITVVGSYNNAYSFAYVNELEVYGYAVPLKNASITDIGTFNNTSSFEVYPNPVTEDYLYAKLNGSTNVQKIEIFDLLGKVKFVKEELNQSEISIDVSSFNKGIYLFRVQIDGKLETRKIIID